MTGSLPRRLGACQLCALTEEAKQPVRTRSEAELFEVRDRTGKGRRPYLVTMASVLGAGGFLAATLHAH